MGQLIRGRRRRRRAAEDQTALVSGGSAVRSAKRLARQMWVALACFGAPACSQDWEEVALRAPEDGERVREKSVYATEPVLTDRADTLLWFSADRGVETNEEGRVKVWADQSGGDRDAMAISPVSGPQAVQRDGRTVIDFDGSTKLRIRATVPGFAELTFFAVASAHPDPDLRCPSILHLSNWISSVSQADRVDFRRQQQELLYQVEEARVKIAPDSHGAFPWHTLHVLNVIQRLDEDARIRIDGKDLGIDEEWAKRALPEVVERSYNFIGHNHYHNDQAPEESCDPYYGQLAEIILMSRPLGDDERDEIERKLAEKWGGELW